MIVSAFLRAFEQLSDRTMRSVLWKVLLMTIAVFAALWTGTGWALSGIEWFQTGWLDTATDWVGGAAAVVVAILVTWVLFPPVSTMFMGIFQDDIIVAVEARHYPGIAPGQEVSLGGVIASTAKLLLITALLNLLALPLYLLLPGLNLLIFYVLNGYLLGREYFEAVALRRFDPRATKRLRKRYQGRVWLTGAGIAFLFSIPILNLLAPLVGTAAMVHVFERTRQTTG
ncbi:MAG: hypothetical protein CMM50_00880 [Rhodospirillaceae bacterium]|nr:hypothetical protein [Rhodospirillaceae bacterium]